MLSFCIAVSRKTLSITYPNKTTLHSPCPLLPGGPQFASISDRTGSVVPFPHGMSSSVQWWQPSCTEQGPGPFATQANCRSLHSHLPFPSSHPLQGLSLELPLFTGGSHQGKATRHSLTEKHCLKEKTNIPPQQNRFPWMQHFEKSFNKFCLVFWQQGDPFLSVFPKETGKKH